MLAARVRATPSTRRSALPPRETRPDWVSSVVFLQRLRAPSSRADAVSERAARRGAQKDRPAQGWWPWEAPRRLDFLVPLIRWRRWRSGPRPGPSRRSGPRSVVAPLPRPVDPPRPLDPPGCLRRLPRRPLGADPGLGAPNRRKSPPRGRRYRRRLRIGARRGSARFAARAVLLRGEGSPSIRIRLAPYRGI